MCRWLGGVAASLLCCLVATGGIKAGPVDCSPAPNVKCLAAEIFSLAKTLPADSFFRRHVAFAEQELAPGDIKIALEYVVSDNPDGPPWEDIDWMARAGRFDRALKQARQRQEPVERLGGLLAVAKHMLDKNDAARARKIIEEIEPALRSIPGDYEYAGLLSRDLGALWVRLEQTDRAVRLMAGAGVDSVGALLDIAGKSSAPERLREQAWREAERGNSPYAWQLLVEDAIKRGDQAEISRAGQRASNAISEGDANTAIALARTLLTAGQTDLSAKLIEPWSKWIDEKDAMRQFNNVAALMPVLVGLARDQDVETAARAISDIYRRSQCLSRAAEAYFQLGRLDVAEKIDAEAMALAASPSTPEPKSQWDREAALRNLALLRADRGDIQGALVAAVTLRDVAKIREVMSYVVRRAIDSGQTPVVGPAIEALQELALAGQDARLMLHVADRWYTVGSENKARSSLAQAMKMIDAAQAKLAGEDLALAAELRWRLDAAGEPEALINIVDKLGVSDAGAIDHLVEIVKPVSPAIAVQLAARQVEVERRIDELANIAIQIAASSK